MNPVVDVVVVAYNSRDRLRACVEPLAQSESIQVIVADNASPDRSLEVVKDLPVVGIELTRNGGFAFGCNVGWRAGSAPYVLFLNPDARMGPNTLRPMVNVLDSESDVGLVAPKLLEQDGQVAPSLRHFPRLRSSFAQALFLHRIFPDATWVDELVRDPGAYEAARDVEWVSGACMLIRRSLLEQIGGFDERFFMYCEDTDLCMQIRKTGFRVRYCPDAHVMHEGGASAPRSGLLPVLAESRIRYAAKHRSLPASMLERLAVALGAATHAAVTRGGAAARSGHARALRAAFLPASTTYPSG